MFTLIAYIITGLIGGSIAKAITPGEEGGDWAATVALGAFGTLLAGWLGQLISDSSCYEIFSIRGLIFSVVSAVIILTVQGWFKKRKAWTLGPAARPPPPPGRWRATSRG